MKNNYIIYLLVFLFIKIDLLKAETSIALYSSQIENLTGAKGSFDIPSGTFMVTLPHKDLKVSTAGVILTPALGLTSSALFKSKENEGEVEADAILLEDQANLVLKKAIESDLQVTSLQSPYLWETPRIMVLRLEGKGSIPELASAVGKVFESIKQSSKSTFWQSSPATIDPSKTTFDIQNLNTLLGIQGTLKDGVYTVDFTALLENKQDLDREFKGWATLSGTDKQAILLGEFTASKKDIQNVLKSLIKQNILILNIHQQLRDDSQGVLLVRYFKRGRAMELVKGIKEVINSTTIQSYGSNSEIIPQDKQERLKKYN